MGSAQKCKTFRVERSAVKSYTENDLHDYVHVPSSQQSAMPRYNMLHLYVKQLEPHLFNIYE